MLNKNNIKVYIFSALVLFSSVLFLQNCIVSASVEKNPSVVVAAPSSTVPGFVIPSTITCLDTRPGQSAPPTPMFTFYGNDNYRKAYSSSGDLQNRSIYFRMDGTKTVWSIKLIIASGDNVGRQDFLLSHVEGPSSQRANRKIVISKSMCDTDTTNPNNFTVFNNSGGGGMEIAVNNRNSPSRIKLYEGTYYINVQNTACPDGQMCDAAIEWSNF